MIISAIVAMGKNRLIGSQNTLPWHLPLEFQHFKEKTMGHILISGRKSFESIGGALPGRPTIVLTRDPHYPQENCEVKHNFTDALELAKERGEKEVFVVGGSNVYEVSLPYLHRLYRTIVDFEGEGDVYFPPYEHYPWQVKEKHREEVGPQNSLSWTYELLEKDPEEVIL